MLAGDTEDGQIKYIQRCVTFTEKTRYLFEINKGLAPAKTQSNPYLVNEDVAQEKLRVPFSNIIFVGDGLTDIPCFSLVKHFGGTPIGVFDPRTDLAAKRALLEFLKPERVISIHAPKYRKTDDLGAIIRAAVAVRCGKIELERKQAEALS